MRNKIVVFSCFLVESFATWRWLACQDFQGGFHLSFAQLQLHINDNIYTDKGTSMMLTRLFHNKLIDLVLEIYARLIHFWDVTLLLHLISLVGIFGIGCVVYYFFTQKKSLLVPILFVFVLLMQGIELFLNPHIPFALQLVLLVLPLQALSLIGISQYSARHRSKLSTLLLLVLLGISLWVLLALPKEMFIYCLGR